MKRRHGINTSVTVRKPQEIPPTGKPCRNPPGSVVISTQALPNEIKSDIQIQPPMQQMILIPNNYPNFKEPEVQQPQYINSINTSLAPIFNNQPQILIQQNVVNSLIGSQNQSYFMPNILGYNIQPMDTQLLYQ